MLGILARIAVDGRRSPSVIFLLLAGSGLLAADALYGLSQLNGDWSLGGPTDVGWLLFYVLGGASALHPSMVGLTEPRVVAGAGGTRRTLADAAVLGTTSLVAPAVLFVEAMRGPVVHGMVIAVASALLALLTATRVTFLAGTLRRSASREHELRLACEELLSAATTEAVADVVRTAIGRLVPAGAGAGRAGRRGPPVHRAPSGGQPPRRGGGPVAARLPGPAHRAGQPPGVPGRGSVYRLADDEFGLVVAGLRLDDVLDQAEAAFGEPFRLAGSVLTAQAGAGVASTATAADFQQLLSQAGVALGEAKAAGKGRRQRYESSMHDRVLKRRRLRADLDRALAEDALDVYYQPIVALDTGCPRGLEALVRWPHPALGMVPPLDFIDIAEESGLIVPLGAWVLRTSVLAATRWWQRDPAHAPYISVNVSVRQFRAHHFVDHIFRELADAGLPPRLLTLEITESLLLGDDDQITADIARLREAGIRVSIDDFGTGYSSLSYLHRISVDTLKLDKSFVDDIAASPRQLGLVRGIIQLAHTLQIDVVAEGIETERDRDLLIDADCGYGQGYLFARPMPHRDADAYLLAALGPAAEVAELGRRNAAIGGPE
jgi:EAL domain-containing protein (putative c-di-GMP-specific phosphodiesterase class I)